MHCNLKYFNMRVNSLGGFAYNYKSIQKMVKPEWPKLLEFATKTSCIADMRKCNLTTKDMETIAYMLADNHYGDSKMKTLTLS